MNGGSAAALIEFAAADGTNADGSPAGQRQRILVAFIAAVQRAGIRRVVMSDLARELGISTKTLYREFRTKDELLRAGLDTVVSLMRHEQEDRFERISDPVERIALGVDFSLTLQQSCSDQFWIDLRADHADLDAWFQSEVFALQFRGSAAVLPLIRPGVAPELVGAMFRQLVVLANDRTLVAAHGGDRLSLIRSILDAWAFGALDPIRIKGSQQS